MGFTLRPYQQEAIDRVLASYKNNAAGTELIVIPTGGGKTVVFATIIDTLAREYGINALIVAHRDELLTQARDKYLEVKPSAIVGKIGGGMAEYGGEVSVCGVGTIRGPKHIKQLHDLYDTGKGLIIVIDEAHHCAANGYQTVINAFPDAFKLYVTATPDRLDGKKILDKNPLYECYLTDMVKAGYLCPPKAIAIKTHVDLNNVKTSMGDFDTHALDLAVNTPERNTRIVEAYQEHTPGKRALCFCVTVAHAEAMTYAFNDQGIPAATVTGETPLDVRADLYKALREGSILVLCNVNVLTEGFDEPSIEAVIMARPTKSRSLYTQCVGRGARLSPGKEHFTVLDLTDNTLKHRLQPMSLKKSLKKDNMKDDETLIEALAREEVEEKEKEIQIRKLADKRFEDIHIDLLNDEMLKWNINEHDVYVLEIKDGRYIHKIAIAESTQVAGTFDLCARFAPDYKFQSWLRNEDLELCQQMAEKKARIIIAGHRDWCDKFASWRNRPATDKQKDLLDKKKINYTDNITSGEAGDLLDTVFAKKEQRESAKQKRREALQERMEA